MLTTDSFLVCHLNQNMNSGLQDIFLRMNMDHQEGTLQNDDLLFENVDYSHCFETADSKIKVENVNNENPQEVGQKIDNQHQDMDMELQSNIKLEKSEGDICENDHFHFENIDGSSFIATVTTGSIIRDTVYVPDNMDTGLMNIKHELEGKRTKNFHSNSVKVSNIFENTYSYTYGKDSEDNDILVDISHIKQEVPEHQEEISNLEDKNYSQDVKYNLNLQDAEIKTEMSDYRIHTDNSCLDAPTLENRNCDVENNDVKIEFSDFNLKEASCNEKSDFLLENCGMDNDTSYFNYEKTDFNIVKCDSGNGAVGFMTVKSDSETDTLGVTLDNHRVEIETDLQPTVVSKGIASTVFDQGSPVFQITEARWCNLQDFASPTGCVSEHTSSKVSHLEVERPYHCTICDTRLKTAQTLKYHMNVHSTGQPHQCSICEKRFKTSKALQCHATIHSTEQPHQCNVCEKRFKTLKALKCHATTHSTGQPHQCSICVKRFKTSKALQCHATIHSTEQPHQCNVCEKRFKTLKALKCHATTHNTEQPHQCNVCGKRFKKSVYLKHHATFHSTEKPHQCSLCDKRFKTLLGSQRHMLTHSNDRPYQCDICKKTFQCSGIFKRHLKTHSQERPYQCDICKKAFKNSDLLKQHLKLAHGSDRPYKCNICEFAFKSSPKLKEHVITHSNERPYKCNICQKAFKTSNVLQQHMKTHTNIRPYKCDICKKDFKSSKILKSHLISHNTERPYKCGICPKKFKSLSYLKRHLLTHSKE